MTILTRKKYWDSIPRQVKSYWKRVAKQDDGKAVVCTHRPSLKTNQYKGNDSVRRCSTGGRHGKSSDYKRMSIKELLRDGFIILTRQDLEKE